MRVAEARKILEVQLASYRGRPFAELSRLVGEPERCEVVSPSGVHFRLEFEAAWAGAEGGPLRVVGCIEDGGVSETFPLASEFFVHPDGKIEG